MWHKTPDEASRTADVIAYLAQTAVAAGLDEPSYVDPWEWRPDEGEAIFHQIGCAACHSDGLDGTELDGDRSHAQWSAMLLVPHKWRDDCPDFMLSQQEADSIAAYILRRRSRSPARTPGLALEIHRFDEERNVLRLADIDPQDSELHLVNRTVALQVDLKHRPGKEFYRLDFSGFVRIPRDGEHEFYLSSDDGSQMWIDGKVCIDNDGRHGDVTKTATLELEKGDHAVRIAMFQNAGDAALNAGFVVDGTKKPFGATDTTHDVWKIDGAADGEGWKVSGDPVRGRLEYEARCAACHEPDERRDMVPWFRPDVGCLAEPGSVPAKAPLFALDADERAALRNAVKHTIASNLRTLPPKESVDARLDGLRCRSCHARGGRGGPTDTNRRFFSGEGDLGDEGVYPPDLTGVGAKLRTAAIAHLLAGQGQVRPYMHTRMPAFSPRMTTGLADALAAADEGAVPMW